MYLLRLYARAFRLPWEQKLFNYTSGHRSVQPTDVP
jgi:hypothetical protein